MCISPHFDSKRHGLRSDGPNAVHHRSHPAARLANTGTTALAAWREHIGQVKSTAVVFFPAANHLNSMRNLKFCLIGLLPFAALTVGQSVTLSLGSGSGTEGGTVAFPVTMVTTGGAQPTAFEFSFSYTSDITSVSVVVGSAAAAANKSVSCSGTTCIVWGMDSTVIAAGSVAVATFQISSSPSTKTIPTQITNVVVSDPKGNSIPGSGISGTISIPVTPSVSLSSLSCTPTTLASGTSTCSVTLTANAPHRRIYRSAQQQQR